MNIKSYAFVICLSFSVSMFAENGCVEDFCETPDSFYFIRHGRTAWSKEMLDLGPQDLSLSPDGFSEVNQTLPALNGLGITKIVSSPLKRCVETAEIISEHLGGVPVYIEKALEERYFGNWAVQKDVAEDLKKNSGSGPEFFGAIRDRVEEILPSDAETKQDFTDRVLDYFHCSCFTGEKEKVLVVAHGCVYYELMEHLAVAENTAGKKKYAVPIVFELNNNRTWNIHL